MPRRNINYKLKLLLPVLLIITTIFISRFFLPNSNPDIILITIDALRADHLSCYGYQRATSPNLDSLAREGVIFRNCFSVSNATNASFPAIFTGLYLINYFHTDNTLSNTLDKKFTTLAEYLKRMGYYTAAFMGNDSLRRGYGFEQGFDIYDSPSNDTPKLTEKVVDFLFSYYSGRKKPLFLWMHYLDPHAPFTPPERFKDLFVNDPLYLQDDKILELYPYERGDDRCYIPRAAFQEGKYSLNDYIASYDAEIRFVDFHVGRVLSSLDRDRDAVIIITSDHGECFGEGDKYFMHGSFNDATLHIPLIIKDNKFFKGGKSVSCSVSTVDIVPTVLSRVNPLAYFFLQNSFHGIDLKELFIRDKSRRKYIYSYAVPKAIIREVNENIVFPMYERKNKEFTNYSGNRDILKQELRKWLKNKLIPSTLAPKKGELDKEALDKLKNLGYLQ